MLIYLLINLLIYIRDIRMFVIFVFYAALLVKTALLCFLQIISSLSTGTICIVSYAWDWLATIIRVSANS
jgi:hypothetical protein